MSIEPISESPAYQALVTAFASFKKQLPITADEKTKAVVSSIMNQKKEQIHEGVQCFDVLTSSSSMKGSHLELMTQFSRLKTILEHACVLTSHGQQLKAEEKDLLKQCVQEYETFLKVYSDHLELPESGKQPIVQNLSMKTTLEKLTSAPGVQSTTGLAQETELSHVEKHHPPKPAEISPKTFKVLYDSGTQSLLGSTKPVQYMVKYRLGCAMQEKTEAQAKTGVSPAPFTTEDLEKLGLSTILRECEKTGHVHASTVSDLKIVQKDLESHIKGAKGPEKKKLETALKDLQGLEKQLNSQAAKFETFASFMGPSKELPFTPIAEQYDALKKRIESTQKKLNDVKAELKKR